MTAEQRAAVAALDAAIRALQEQRAALVGDQAVYRSLDGEPEPEPPVEFESTKIAAHIIGASPSGIRAAAEAGLLGKSYKLSERKWLIDMGAARLWAKTLPAW